MLSRPGPGGAGPGDTLALPTSDPNTAFYWQQKDALAASAPGGGGGGAVQNLEPSRQLLHLARSIQAQEHKQVAQVPTSRARAEREREREKGAFVRAGRAVCTSTIPPTRKVTRAPFSSGGCAWLTRPLRSVHGVAQLAQAVQLLAHGHLHAGRAAQVPVPALQRHV